MSGYQYAASQEYAGPPQGPGGQSGYRPPSYQTQPQQGWDQQPQQPYPPQQSGYQSQPYPYPPQPGYQSAPPYPSSQGHGVPPQNQYGSPPQSGQYGGPPPQGGYGSPPPPQQQWGPPPQGQQHSASPGPEKSFPVVFRFSGTCKTIKNSQVTDQYGKTPFSIVSDKKHTKVLASGGSIIAAIDWSHSSPTIESPLLGNGSKQKIKEWMQSVGPNERIFKHGNHSFRWVIKNENLIHLEFADRAGHTILIGRDEPSGQVVVEAFRDALVIPGLLEICITLIMIMETGQSLGDGGLFNSQAFMNAFVSTSIASAFTGGF